MTMGAKWVLRLVDTDDFKCLMDTVDDRYLVGNMMYTKKYMSVCAYF